MTYSSCGVLARHWFDHIKIYHYVDLACNRFLLLHSIRVIWYTLLGVKRYYVRRHSKVV